MKRLKIELDIMAIFIVIFWVVEIILFYIGYGWIVGLFVISVLILGIAYVLLEVETPVVLIIFIGGAVVFAVVNNGRLLIWYVILFFLCSIVIEHIIRWLKRKD